MELMNMPDAWEAVYGAAQAPAQLTGHPRIIIACLDDGVPLNYKGRNVPIGENEYHTHLGQNWNSEAVVKPGTSESLAGHYDFFLGTNPDAPIATNQWLNEAELTGQTNIDDDGNGYVDDVFGWDFVGDEPLVFESGDRIPYPDYYPEFSSGNSGAFNKDRGHGKLIGVAAARGNNDVTGSTSRGIAGMCWTAEVMPVRYHINNFSLDHPNPHSFDVFTNGRLELAIKYATDSGARVLTVLIGETYDLGVETAIRAARGRGAMIIAPAGNENISTDAAPM